MSKKWYKKSKDGLTVSERMALIRSLIEINVECQPNKRDILLHLDEIEKQIKKK